MHAVRGALSDASRRDRQHFGSGLRVRVWLHRRLHVACLAVAGRHHRGHGGGDPCVHGVEALPHARGGGARAAGARPPPPPPPPPPPRARLPLHHRAALLGAVAGAGAASPHQRQAPQAPCDALPPPQVRRGGGGLAERAVRGAGRAAPRPDGHRQRLLPRLPCLAPPRLDQRPPPLRPLQHHHQRQLPASGPALPEGAG
mmetsp:Transcript_61852/g.145470  ORF Transcript_61852/g.145470 Transcript_61852/m.145470 type:complete len:200 (-) Transcript_61852:63-662(-)